MEVINDDIVSCARVADAGNDNLLGVHIDFLVDTFSMLLETKPVEKTGKEKRVVVGVITSQVLDCANTMSRLHEEKGSWEEQGVHEHLQKALRVTSVICVQR